MAIIVEDGSVVTGANSYISEADLTSYATARGKTLTATAAVLIIQAMDYIESLDYIGYKYSEDQSLQWPRSYVVIDGYDFDDDEIPQLLIDALAEVAIAVDEGTSPFVDIAPAIKRSKTDVLETEYKDGASSTTLNRKIKLKLNKLLRNSTGAFETVKA